MSSSIGGDIMDNVPIIDPGIMDDPGKAVEAVEADVLNKNDGGSSCASKVQGSHEEESSKFKLNDPELSSEGAIIDSHAKLQFPDVSGYSTLDSKVAEQQQLINNSKPSTELEKALFEEIQRKNNQIERLTGELLKLKQFVSKRKQVYKRKRKDGGAPTRALSAYNIFVQDRFSRLKKQNEEALKSSDSGAIMKRVPPASLVASTGFQWKELPADEKAYYEERAKADRKRYEEEMANYQPPDKGSNKKRNKTGYNMFFTFHVNKMKDTDTGVPSERGSVARLVGNAWKELSSDQKLQFEQMADRQNAVSDGEDDNISVDEEKLRNMEYNHGAPVVAIDPNAHRQMMPPQMGHAPVVHQPAHHDPRLYPPPHGPHNPYQPYPPPPPGYYEYPPPPPYAHVPPPQHPPPPPQHQHGQGQRSGIQQDRNGQHQVPAPHPGHAQHPPHPYSPHPHPHPHHHHFHPHPPPPPHHQYNPPHMEQQR